MLGSFVEERFPKMWLDAFLLALGTDLNGDAELFAEIPSDVVDDVVKGLGAKERGTTSRSSLWTWVP